MIKWDYINQSQQQRKHMSNRLFIVCDGKNSMKLKSDFNKIDEHIIDFMEYYKTRKFNELEIKDSGKSYTVNSEIIYITD